MTALIDFEVSGLEESSTNAVSRYEIWFSEPVNANWLTGIIRDAIDVLIICPDCKNLIDPNKKHICIKKYT